jgi:hypothetical protein
MNGFQATYTLALLALSVPAWGRQRYALGWLVGNLVATLAVCLAMDFGALGRNDATMAMLIVDLASGVGLALRPGIPRLIAWGYAVTVPIYFATLGFGVSHDATFAVIYIVATAQLGVLCLGCASGSGGGGVRRSVADRVFVVSQTRDGAPSGPLVSPSAAGNRVS